MKMFSKLFKRDKMETLGRDPQSLFALIIRPLQICQKMKTDIAVQKCATVC